MLFQRSIPVPLGMMFATLVSFSCADLGQASESIIVRYKSEEATVTRQDLDRFADTGEMPTDLQKLLGTDAQVPNVVQTLLKKEIKIPKFVERFIEGSNGDFLLLKLDDAISSASGSTEKDLAEIRTAVLDSIADNRVSFIELIAKHPQTQIQLDLTRLEGTYQDVRGFVERVLPALEVAKGVLQDLVCDCDTAKSAAEPEVDATSKQYQSADAAIDRHPSEKCNHLEPTEKAVPIETK